MLVLESCDVPYSRDDDEMLLLLPDTVNEANVLFLIRLKPSMIAITTNKKTTTDFP